MQKVMKNAHKNRYVTRISQKYLKGGAKILEGGCGLGQKLFALSKKGFDVVGIDNAEKTVEKMNKLYPELNIQKGDLRWLEFPDETFDGYWSFGVIEHDIDGFDHIMSEMHRILKVEGYLFITFPFMNLLRKIKAKLDLYNAAPEDEGPNLFYQYIYNDKLVANQFQRNGFRFIERRRISSIHGLMDELGFLEIVLNLNHRYRAINHTIKGFRFFVNKLLQIFFPELAAHSVLFVFQKK